MSTRGSNPSGLAGARASPTSRTISCTTPLFFRTIILTRQTLPRLTLSLVDELTELARNHLGDDVEHALAPGRVNLIGEHTDYNDGFVLPMAIDRHVGLAFRPRTDRRLRVFAFEFGETHDLDLDRLEEAQAGWSRYVAGVAWAMQDAGAELRGADLLIHGNIPVGAGLSSSAALEMAVALALSTMAGIPWDPAQMARLGQRAENDFVGVSCGIMDQLTSAASAEGSALLIDCRSLATEQVDIPEAARVVVMDTGVRRMLSDGIYNKRFEECRHAVTLIRRRDRGVRALRDVSPEQLGSYRDLLPPVIFRRARHVVHENERPLAMSTALKSGNLAAAGRLMYQSHASLRDLYDVSIPELDGMVEEAQKHPACFGARLTGAGLGGCAVALINGEERDDFTQNVLGAYRARFDHPAALYVCRPSAGAHLLEMEKGRMPPR